MVIGPLSGQGCKTEKEDIGATMSVMSICWFVRAIHNMMGDTGYPCR